MDEIAEIIVTVGGEIVMAGAEALMGMKDNKTKEKKDENTKTE